MDLEKAFIQFLKSKRVLTRFKKNLKPRRTFKKFINSCSALPEKWIQMGFIWASTPEGHLFWQKLNDEWVDFLRKNGLKI